MPPQETAFREQKAIAWLASGFNREGQHKVVFPGIELDVRWTDTQGEALDARGNLISTDANVIVDRDIPIGSIMWKGDQEQLEAAVPGTGTGLDLSPTSDLYEVVAVTISPDLKARETYRDVRLKRYSDTMPDPA